MQLVVIVKRLNKRTAVPGTLPEPLNIVGVVLEGFRFEGEEVDPSEILNPNLGKWYKDRDGHYYWGGGVISFLSPTLHKGVTKDFSFTKGLELASAESMGWGLDKLSVKEFWTAAGNKGDNVKLAILDTGISSTHPEFDFTKIRRFNVLNNDTIAEDLHGHGSHVAGIIAAKGIEVFGTAPHINLVIIKIADTTDAWKIEHVVAGIQRAIDENVDIISISGEFSKRDPKLEILNQKVTEAINHGITIVASAGNNFSNRPIENFPAAFDACISVGSIKKDGKRADSSSQSTKLDVVAPGEEIRSAWKNGTYNVDSGTSMATPLVSGIVAVLKSFAKTKLQRNLSPAEIHLILNKTADEAGDTGFDTSYGFGIVNPLKALKMLTT